MAGIHWFQWLSFLIPFPSSSSSYSPSCRPIAWVSFFATVAEDFHWYFIYSLINATILSSEEWEQIYCVFLQFAPFFCFLTSLLFLFFASLWGRHMKLWVKLPIRYSFALLCVWDLSRSSQVDIEGAISFDILVLPHRNEFIKIIFIIFFYIGICWINSRNYFKIVMRRNWIWVI